MRPRFWDYVLMLVFVVSVYLCLELAGYLHRKFEASRPRPNPPQLQYCLGNDHPRSEYPQGLAGPCKDIFGRYDI